MIFSTEDGSSRVDVNLFSTAKMVPSDVWMPTAVDPSLTASMAYSTWKSLNTDDKEHVSEDSLFIGIK